MEEEEVKEEEEEEVQAEEASQEEPREERQEVAGTLQNAGQTSNVIQINPHSRAVKNITDMGKVLTGVRSPEHARGKITGHQRIIESLTSLILID